MDISKNDNTLERNEACATVFLKWTDFSLFVKKNGRPMKPFLLKCRTFGLRQTILADKFWGIWGIFGQFINTHFGTVSPLSMFFMFSINQPLFLQKSKPLYLNPKYLFGPQRIRDLVIVCPYLVRGRGGGINSNMST